MQLAVTMCIVLRDFVKVPDELEKAWFFAYIGAHI